MHIATMAIIAAVALAAPTVAAAQTSSDSCILPGTATPIHSVAYYECKGHSATAAQWLATQYASETDSGS